MSSRPDPFRPYRSHDELARGRRRTVLKLTVAVTAVLLAAVAAEHAGDGRLAAVYVVAALLHLADGLAAAVRWSRTELEPDPA